MRISIPDTQVKEPERVLRMQQDIMQRVAAIPGVTSVALATAVPMSGDSSNDPVYAEDHTYREGSIPPIRRFNFVSPGYFATAGIRLLAGRDITWAETNNATAVAVVSESLARELWKDPRAAIGKRIRATLKDDWREIVGVVADVRADGVNQPAPSTVYWPMLAKNFEGDASGLAPLHRHRDPHPARRFHQFPGRTSPGHLERQFQPAAGHGSKPSRNSTTARWPAPPSPCFCWPSPAAWRSSWESSASTA